MGIQRATAGFPICSFPHSISSDNHCRLMVEVMKLQRQKKCIRTAGKRLLLDRKPLRLFFSSRELSISSIELFFFSIWTVWPRYARSDNCPISKKKNSISEMKSSLSEKKLRLRVFPSLSNLFPAARNIYSQQEFSKWELQLPLG